MRTRGTVTYVAAAILAAARATQTVMVDDGDPGIEYRGAWVHNPVQDPKDLNYGGSVTFTNATGSTATYRFVGTGIAVFGAFEVPGTFAMHSTYIIDSGTAVDFLPASTIVTPSYRQKFFQSGNLSNGEHTLLITNGDKEFWLDYLVVTQVSQSTTTAATSTASQKAQTLPSSTAQASPPTADPATPSSTSSVHPDTTQLPSDPSSQTQATQSFSNTNNVPLTSTNAATSAPSPTASTQQSQTSTLVSATSSPSSAPGSAQSARIPAGATAGIAAAGLLAVVLVGIVGWKCRRYRRKQAKHSDLAPYDPGLTALAFEPSEKQERARNSDGQGSTVTSLLSLQQTAPAHSQAPAEIRTSWSSGERNVPHEIRTTGLSGLAMGCDRLTGFEPLGSPSSASPLLARHPRGILRHKDSPVTPSVEASRYTSPLDERRRSIDGGVRIAGGPLGGLRQDDSLGADEDVRSGLSTLPPSYQMYPAA